MGIYRTVLLLGCSLALCEAARAPPAQRQRLGHLRSHLRHTRHHGKHGSRNAGAALPSAPIGFAAQALRKHGRGLSCYSGSDFAVPDATTECAGNENRCLIRFREGADRSAVTRYCSSEDSCALASEDFEPVAGGYVAKCCSQANCNAGIPVQLRAGLYWIRASDDDQKFLSNGGTAGLSFADFANDETQKFSLQRVGDALLSTYTITPAGGTATDQVWSILEVAEGVFTIEMDGQNIAGGQDSKFTLTQTPNWEVGWMGQRCPKSTRFAGAQDVAACQDACQADDNCRQVIEFDYSRNECYLVTDDCPSDELSSGGDFIWSFKAKCALVNCEAATQCHAVGTCNEATGSCSTPFLAEDSACDDGDATTANDACREGVCQGVNLCANKQCPGENQCYDEGTCDVQTGQCVPHMKSGGAACDDGNDNTIGDTCQAGVCSGRDMCANVACDAPDTCHLSGRCDPQTGRCSVVAKGDGSTCDDGRPLTKNDKCTAGVCNGQIDKCEAPCVVQGPCFVLGECDPETGLCSNPFKAQGEVCNDESDVTTDDVCDGAGACSGTNKCEGVTCEAEDQCQDTGTCDYATGQCLTVLKSDNTQCNDDDESTVQDKCIQGACRGENLCAAVTCLALDDCHVAGECNTATGSCSQPLKDDDADCDDDDDFTTADKCTAGVCMGQAEGTSRQQNPRLRSANLTATTAPTAASSATF